MRTLTTYELDLDSTFNQAGDTYDYQERKGKIGSLQLGEVLEVQQLSDIRKKEFITSRKVKVVTIVHMTHLIKKVIRLWDQLKKG